MEHDRKLGRIEIPDLEGYPFEDTPVELMLPKGAHVFSVSAQGGKVWAYFHYVGPSWRGDKTNRFPQKFILWFHGNYYNGPLGRFIGTVCLNSAVAHLFEVPNE